MEIDVEVAAPELADTAPDTGWVSRTVDALEHACNGAACQLVLIAVLFDKVANVCSDRLFFLACLLLVLQPTHHRIKR